VEFPSYMCAGQWHCTPHGEASCTLFGLSSVLPPQDDKTPSRLSVTLTDPGPRRVRVATPLRQHCGISLEQALAFVETSGAVVVHRTEDAADAQALLEAIIHAGGTGLVAR